MDFHLATPTGDVYLFSYDGRQVQIPVEPTTPQAPVAAPFTGPVSSALGE